MSIHFTLMTLHDTVYFVLSFFSFFFFNDTATTEIYTLSLHDALPISGAAPPESLLPVSGTFVSDFSGLPSRECGLSLGSDRKSTRLNSSHPSISYAVFCLKKKKKKIIKYHLIRSHVIIQLIMHSGALT